VPEVAHLSLSSVAERRGIVSYLLLLVALVGLPLAALTRWRAHQPHPRAHNGARLLALGIAVPAAMV